MNDMIFKSYYIVYCAIDDLVNLFQFQKIEWFQKFKLHFIYKRPIRLKIRDEILNPGFKKIQV